MIDLFSQYKVFLIGRGRVGPQWSKDLRDRPVHRLYYINSGYARMKTADGVIHLYPGKLYFFPAFSIESSYCPKMLDLNYFHFSTSHDYLRSLWDLTDSQMEIQSPFSMNQTHEMFQTLEQGYKSTQLAARLECRGIMDRFLAPFFSDFEELSDTPMEQIVQYIEDHLSDDLSLEQLALEIHYSPNYLCTLFRQYHGTTPIQFIRKRRIEKAQELLHSTSLGVYEIASQVGISDGQYFTRIFKQHVGMTALQYRRSFQ